ncbi:MAG TPA: tetratricopeptide repeat protein [Thermoanaerobaculia bacterium]|jgi:tetratricopeptide (TPR) repeat protein
MTARRAPVLLALLGALAAVPFAAVLGAGFVFDDENEVVGSVTPLATFGARLPHLGRPLLKITYALGARVHGPSPAGFRLFNVALHAGSAVLVFLLAGRGLSARRPGSLAGAGAAAFAGAALWALHPLAAETVTYVSGRSMGLSTFLVLASLALVAAEGVPSRGRALGAALFAFLAPLAKETALVLPLLLVWWEATLGPCDVPMRDRSRRLAPVFAGTAGAALALALLPRHRELLGFSLAVRPPLEALRGNVQAVPAMLGLWAIPWRLSIDPARPLEWAWTEAPTLLGLAFLGSLAAIALAARRRAPFLAFALGWTLLALAPGNSFVWRLDPVGVRPLYLASVGPAVLAAALVGAALAARAPAFGRAALACALALASALGAGLVVRNARYRSPVALWEDAVQKAPRNARAKNNLGFAYLAAGRLDDAERLLEAARDADPGMTQPDCGLAAIRIQRGTR